MRERVARETERRLAGEVLAATLSGRLGARRDSRPARALRRSASGRRCWPSSSTTPRRPRPTLGRASREPGPRGAGRAAPGGAPRAALRGGRRREGRPPRARERGARRRWRPSHGPTRAAASRSLPTRARAPLLPRGALRARGDRASPTAPLPRWPPTATSARSRCCSRCRTTRRCASTARACSGRSRTPTSDYAGELLRSLEAYIERNGHWERAASDCYCHRHTLRYRIKRIEELTGRDLSRANDRIELWLALRAKELIA